MTLIYTRDFGMFGTPEGERVGMCCKEKKPTIAKPVNLPCKPINKSIMAKRIETVYKIEMKEYPMFVKQKLILAKPIKYHGMMHQKIEDILFGRSQGNVKDIIIKHSNVLTPLDVSLIIEIFERRRQIFYLETLIMTDSFKKAPFSSSITKAFTRLCFMKDINLFFLAISRKENVRPQSVMCALGAFLGFSLLHLDSMKKWVANVNCPLLIRWDVKKDPNENLEIALQFVDVIKLVLEKPKPIKNTARIIQDWQYCVPKIWWDFVYERLSPELQVVLKNDKIRWFKD